MLLLIISTEILKMTKNQMWHLFKFRNYTSQLTIVNSSKVGNAGKTLVYCAINLSAKIDTVAFWNWNMNLNLQSRKFHALYS